MPPNDQQVWEAIKEMRTDIKEMRSEQRETREAAASMAAALVKTGVDLTTAAALLHTEIDRLAGEYPHVDFAQLWAAAGPLDVSAKAISTFVPAFFDQQTTDRYAR